MILPTSWKIRLVDQDRNRNFEKAMTNDQFGYLAVNRAKSLSFCTTNTNIIYAFYLKRGDIELKNALIFSLNRVINKKLWWVKVRTFWERTVGWGDVFCFNVCASVISTEWFTNFHLPFPQARSRFLPLSVADPTPSLCRATTRCPPPCRSSGAPMTLDWVWPVGGSGHVEVEVFWCNVGFYF